MRRNLAGAGQVFRTLARAGWAANQQAALPPGPLSPRGGEGTLGGSCSQNLSDALKGHSNA
jgi:hypothetical protein